MASRLNPEIREKLEVITGLSGKSLGEKITRMTTENPGLTRNAAAQLIAQTHHKSVMQKLEDADKASLHDYLALHRTPAPRLPAPMTVRQVSRRKVARESKSFRAFDGYTPRKDDKFFAGGYIAEVGRAYGAECYTCTLILIRKIVENLIIDILEKKFPSRPG